MSSSHYKKLNEIIDVLESGSRPKGGVSIDSGDIPSLGAEHLNNEGGFNFSKIKKIDNIFFEKMRNGKIKYGDILIVKDGATTGKVSFVDHDFPFKKAAVNEHVFILRVDNNISIPKYVFHFLRSPKGKEEILSDFRGATVGGISRGFLDKVSVPFPPLEEQQRIASILDKAELVMRKRELAIEKLDRLAQSVFYEMFGDPIANNKGWEKVEIKNFGKITTGNTPSRRDLDNYDSNFIEWIKTNNIIDDSIFIDQSIEHLSQKGVKSARVVTKGALLVACIAGSIESIGRASLTDRTVSFNQQINAIQPNTDINPFYLYSLFRVSREYIQSHATKGMKRLLTKGEFEKIKMIKPPFLIQNQYAAIFENLINQKNIYLKSDNKIKSLLNSLNFKEFKVESKT